MIVVVSEANSILSERSERYVKINNIQRAKRAPKRSTAFKKIFLKK